MTPAVASAARRKYSKPLSLVATRIVQEALDDEVDLARLAKLAGADPGFAARVVSTVNSGAFGLPRTVSDVRQACSLLGVRGLRNLALSLVVSDMVPAGADGDALLEVSIRRAAAARLIAQAVGEAHVEEYFTTGLFLEIGLLHGARENLPGSAEIARMPAAHRPTIERAQGRKIHPESGADLARALRLPEAMIEAVLRHHDQRPGDATASRVAWAAERVAGAFEGGDAEQTRRIAMSALDTVGVPPDSAMSVLDRLPALVTEVSAVFDRPMPEQENLDQLVANANRRLVEMNNGYERLIRQLEQLVAEKEELTSQLRRANAELEAVAATDPLTGLSNRRSFEEALKRDFSRADRSNGPISVIALDIDFFKKVNDTHGHGTGDLVLQKVAEVLRAGLRTGDVPARLGGEEFVALLPGADAEGGHIVAERIRAALAATAMTGPTGPFTVTTSIGVAACRGASCRDGGKGALERADAALYEAKRSGRNRVVLAK